MSSYKVFQDLYSCVESFLTTCRIDVANFGNYEIHSVAE